MPLKAVKPVGRDARKTKQIIGLLFFGTKPGPEFSKALLC